MVHPALFRAEVRFCGNFGGNAVIRYLQRDCVDTWEKPPPGKGGGQALRNEMSRIRTLERAPVVPEVPTVAEAGYRSLNHDDLVGLFSTKQTPTAWPTDPGCDSIFALIRGGVAWRANLH